MPDDEQKQLYAVIDALIRDYKVKSLLKVNNKNPAHGRAYAITQAISLLYFKT